MRRATVVPLLFSLALTSACTFLESEGGLVGPPLVADAGADATIVEADGAPGPASGDDASRAESSADAGPGPIYTQLLSPTGIAVYKGTICWVAGQSLRMIQCAPTSGAGASAVVTVASQSDDTLVDQAFDVALDDTYWYWSNGPNNQIVRKAMSGGASLQYFSGDQRLSYIFLDGANLWATDYVAGETSGNIVVGPSGTTSMLVFPGETLAAGVAVYSGSVYWGRGSPGSVSFALESGNTTITRVATSGAVTGLAMDAAGTTYFVSGDQQIFKLLQGADTPTLIYDAGSSFGDGDLALDDQWVYWSENGPGVIMRMPK
jgi:hypothetical protein